MNKLEERRIQELEILRKGENESINFLVDKYGLKLNHIDIIYHTRKSQVKNNIVLLSYYDKVSKIYKSYILF